MRLLEGDFFYYSLFVYSKLICVPKVIQLLRSSDARHQVWQIILIRIWCINSDREIQIQDSSSPLPLRYVHGKVIASTEQSEKATGQPNSLEIVLYHKGHNHSKPLD